MVQLRGRVAIVTGADSKVGQAVARVLAGEGVSLMLIAQPGRHVRDLAEELSESCGVRCFPAALNVTDPTAVDRIVMHAEQHVGTVDIVVNTVAGQMSKALAPTMQQRGRGIIINVAPAPAERDVPDVVESISLAWAELDVLTRDLLAALKSAGR